MSEYLLEMKGMCKDFSGIRVLSDVSLSLKKGEVMAIVGENGAGKSTLIRTLSGSLAPTEGEIYINGKKTNFKGPVDGLNSGISVIYQELNYYNELSIVENIFAGRLLKKRTGRIDWKRMTEEATETIEKVGLNVDANTLVKELTVSQKQLVEISKAISRNAQIIVMDEPTAALNDAELEKLFDVIDGLKERGISVIYISHKLNEILRVADYAKVLRDGKDIGTLCRDEFDKSKIVQMMVGRKIEDMYPKVKIEPGEKLLEVDNISGGILKDVSFNIRRGEIVSIFGLMGNGAHALLEYIFGAKTIDKGSIKFKNEVLNIKDPADAIEKGMAYIPPERKSEGLVLMHSVGSNLSLPSITEYSKGYKMDVDTEKKDAQSVVERLTIKINNLNDSVDSLSGGNQQKVVIGKWIKKSPSLLIVCEPTRGIDVGAKIEVYKLLEEMCKNGVGVLMVSSELPETLAMSDRIYAINDGMIMGEFSRDEATQEGLMSCIVGGEVN